VRSWKLPENALLLVLFKLRECHLSPKIQCHFPPKFTQIASYFRGKSDEGNIYQIPYKKLKIDGDNLDVLLLDTEDPNDKWLRFKLKSTSKHPPIKIGSSNSTQPTKIDLADTYHVIRVSKID
jgi:hypothetical protein